MSQNADRAAATSVPTGLRLGVGVMASVLCLAVLGIFPLTASADPSPGQGFLVSVQDNGPPINGQPVDNVLYSGTLPSPPTTCPAPGEPPPSFLISGGGALLSSGNITITTGPTQESVTGAGHDLLTDYTVSVQAGPNGENPTGSLTLNGFFTFTATPTCLKISGNEAVMGFQIEPNPTSSGVSCSTSTPASSNATNCTAPVTDTASSGQTTPTGTVSFTSSGGGSFGASSCALSGGSGASASCAVVFRAPRGRTEVITARYGGDVWHTASRGTTVVQKHPTIYRVSFRGGPINPEIVVYGRNFGRRPKADPPGGTSNLGKCGRIKGNTGKDYGTSLWLDDHSQLWSAGYRPYVDCMGLIVTKYTDREIVYRLGSFYAINYEHRNGFSHGIYELAEDDSVTLTVKGTTFTAPVRYAGSFTTFTTPGSHLWTVPRHVWLAAFDLFGGQGGGYAGGQGGHVRAVLHVHPGERLRIEVGGQGGSPGPSAFDPPPSGGFGGGGGGGSGEWPTTGSPAGGGGGGASDVRAGPAGVSGLSSRLLIAGAGGGTGRSSDSGGGAGGRVGISGQSSLHGGGGGTVNSGGIGGVGASIGCGVASGYGAPGGSGQLGVGGVGGLGQASVEESGPVFGLGGGGGGGGLYGGGGGSGGYSTECPSSFNSPAGGGGGGSSFVIRGRVCRPTFQSGVRSGDGEVDIAYNPRHC
jgi:hypothetical protein